MASMTESYRLPDFLKWEEDNRYSREKVTVASGESVSVGEVVGKVKRSVPSTGTADVGNTGDGTCTDVSGGTKTQVGTYTLECTAAATNGGTFKVTAPDGTALPDAEVGTAYSNEQINFTLNDGATDFVVGDTFTIEVSEGSGKVKPIDFSAVDGTEEAYGIMAADCDASSADTDGVAIVRDAIVSDDHLVWPDGATADQKTSALTTLAGKGIIVRDEA